VLSRAVRIVNVSIALLAVLIAAVIYWYALRPLPKTAGEITAPISSSATVKRDARGIPHIEAASWQDAVFLQGYVTAQDRLWQMDVLRRFAAGELAEVFGAAALHEDERSRRIQMRAIAEADAKHLTAEEGELLAAYTRGVNFFIATHHGDYSLEFSLPGHQYNPRPWSPVDSILVGLVMYRNLTDSAATDLERGQLLAVASDVHKFQVLFPTQEGAYVSPGSNAWAVSGAHSIDGKPLVANDPHLEYGIPCTWHLVHLQAPELNVSGGALPGLPGVITGHNENIAWGETNLQADVEDLYIEQIDDRTGRYLFQGRVEQARLDKQKILIRGGKPVKLDTWITRHGPVIGSSAGRGYSLRWTAADGFRFPFWDIDRARNWQEFRAALSSYWGPAQNFIYGDKAGNIGYQAAGRVPIRRNFPGNVPVDGALGLFEWDGYIPFEQMPSEHNPPSGIVATANQDPFPPGYPYSVSGSFADPYRVRQIRARLTANAKLDVADMLAVQKDVYSAYGCFLAGQIQQAVAAKGKGDRAAAEAVAVLARWNGQMDWRDPAPVITEFLSNQLGASLVLLMTKPAYLSGASKIKLPLLLPRPFVIEKLLRDRPSGWVPKDDWNGWILKNLNTALEQARRRLGSPMAKWRWGQVLQWNIAHPVGKQLPLVNYFFDIGPIEMSGSGTTVKQTTATLGPSERMVVDFADLDKSVQNLPTGESGNVASGHYKDQWPAYYAGTSFPMEFYHVDAKEVLHIKPAAASTQ
jgi:penicillin G amidase